ncbi:MAG: DUF721 domain-containing protein [Hahellaceae bacterium]|nr:DUF721 domain-containing protein [Hahellaceae bacterium]MCP5169862.1 DUF721 domain-containing protein [Hahellaceae bacterium]
MKNARLTDVTGLNELTQSSNDLNRLFRQAQAVIRLESNLNELLPDTLKFKFKIANIQSGTLVLITSSAVLATRFKFIQSEILASLAHTPSLQRITKINVKIRPNRYKTVRERKELHLSEENARLLVEEAGHTEDVHLRAVLLKLAERANKPV